MRRVVSLAGAVALAAVLTACVPGQTEPAPTVTETVTAQPEPAPTVTETATVEAPAPVVEEAPVDASAEAWRTAMEVTWDDTTQADRDSICWGFDVMGAEWVLESMDTEAPDDVVVTFFEEVC